MIDIDAPRLLVVSADAGRRERWARVFAETGYDITCCAGPGASCPVLQRRRCSLLAEADIALYDRASFVPPIARAVAAFEPYDAVVLVGEDDAAGRPSGVRRVGHSGFPCFGSTL